MQTIWEYAVGDKDKRSTNGHIMYAMIHPSLYLVQIATEWGIFRRQMVCATAGYLLSNPPLVCDLPTTFTAVLKSQVPNDLKSKQDMGTTPHKAMGVGSLTTIHRASKCLPQVVRYLQCIQKTSMYAWVRKKPKDCNSKWWTYNTITTTKKLRRALRTAIAVDANKTS